MDKAVLLSIKPVWCRKIILNEKTVEVSKTKPKIMKPPFKCYIYCTMVGSNELFLEVLNRDVGLWYRENWHNKRGKIIGEFVCDEIYKIDMDSSGFNFTAPSLDLPVYTLPENNDEEGKAKLKELTTCLTDAEISKYLGIHPGYGWHISDLKIYDNPRKLEEFTGLRRTRFGMRPIKVQRPPQSWYYVEELK